MANTATNRKMTFGVSGGHGALKHHVGGFVAFGVGLALTSGSLWALHHSTANPSWLVEVSLLVVVNLVATVVRFLTLRQLMKDPAHS